MPPNHFEIKPLYQNNVLTEEGREIRRNARAMLEKFFSVVPYNVDLLELAELISIEAGSVASERSR